MLITWNGWKIFIRLNTIKEFATFFSSLTLHAINLLLWKKILSLTIFKIITVNRSSFLLRVFLLGRSGYPTNRGHCRWGSTCKSKSLNFPLLLDINSSKKLSPPVPLLITDHILEKMLSLLAFSVFVTDRVAVVLFLEDNVFILKEDLAVIHCLLEQFF